MAGWIRRLGGWILRMQADSGDVPPQAIRLRLEGTLTGVREGIDHVLALPPCAQLSVIQLGTLRVLLAEVLNNIVEHAYAGGAGPIRLTLAQGPAGLLVGVEDDGAPMPGGHVPQGRPPVPDHLPEGGFGWHMIRCLTSSLRYERCGGTNRLWLVVNPDQ